MTAVGHDCGRELGGFELLADLGDIFSAVVRAVRATTKYDVAVWVALRGKGVGPAFVIDTKKSLRLAGRFDCINRNSQATVGAVLKTEWHGET